jgi:hypothetical protein
VLVRVCFTSGAYEFIFVVSIVESAKNLTWTISVLKAKNIGDNVSK